MRAGDGRRRMFAAPSRKRGIPPAAYLMGTRARPEPCRSGQRNHTCADWSSGPPPSQHERLSTSPRCVALVGRGRAPRRASSRAAVRPPAAVFPAPRRGRVSGLLGAGRFQRLGHANRVDGRAPGPAGQPAAVPAAAPRAQRDGPQPVAREWVLPPTARRMLSLTSSPGGSGAGEHDQRPLGRRCPRAGFRPALVHVCRRPARLGLLLQRRHLHPRPRCRRRCEEGRPRRGVGDPELYSGVSDQWSSQPTIWPSALPFSRPYVVVYPGQILLVSGSERSKVHH